MSPSFIICSLECLPHLLSTKQPRCLKITEKVSFYIASEVSEQKYTKNTKNGPIWRVFENLKLAVKQSYQTGRFNRSKIGGNAKIQKFKCDILGDFQTLCLFGGNKSVSSEATMKQMNSWCNLIQSPNCRLGER